MSVGDLVRVGANEFGATLSKILGVQVAHAFAFFAGHFALHGDDDATVGQGVGEAADGRHDFGAPAGEAGESREVQVPNLRYGRLAICVTVRFIGDADDVGGFAAVAGVEDAAEFVVALQEGVGFVDEEGGFSFLDDAEERRGTDIGGGEGAMDEFTEDAEQRGFAAAFLR